MEAPEKMHLTTVYFENLAGSVTESSYLYQEIKVTLKTLSAEGFETQMAGSCDNWF